MDINDDKDQNYQLSSTDDLKNNENKDTIELAKKSPSAAAQIETSLFSSIAKIPIVSKQYLFSTFSSTCYFIIGFYIKDIITYFFSDCSFNNSNS